MAEKEDTKTAAKEKAKKDIEAIIRSAGGKNYYKATSEYKNTAANEEFISAVRRSLSEKVLSTIETMRIEKASSIFEEKCKEAPIEESSDQRLNKTMLMMGMPASKRAAISRVMKKMQKHGNVMKLQPIERRILMDFYKQTSAAVENRPTMARMSLNPGTRKVTTQ